MRMSVVPARKKRSEFALMLRYEIEISFKRHFCQYFQVIQSQNINSKIRIKHIPLGPTVADPYFGGPCFIAKAARK